MPLKYVTERPIDFSPNSHVVLCVVRNEMLRLPYLLTYYRSIGFDRFIFVDNASTDGTGEYVLAQPDAFVFQTADSFGAGAGAGLRWKNAILNRFCVKHWVLVADADEMLVWPGSERENIRALTAKLEVLGAEALFTVMLDMYSDKPLGEIGYTAGMPFLDYAPYFDLGPYKFITAQAYPFKQIYGGVRARLFREYRDAISRKQLGQNAKFMPPTASKVPLVRWRKGQHFILAQHALEHKVPLAPMRAALLHFKMFDDIVAKCEIESARGQHFAQSSEYRVLGAAIKDYKGRSFLDTKYSVRYLSTKQLVSLKLMDPAKAF